MRRTTSRRLNVSPLVLSLALVGGCAGDTVPVTDGGADLISFKDRGMTPDGPVTPDRGAPDLIAADLPAFDVLAPDLLARDGAVGDTAVGDTAVADTAVGDTAVADTAVGDTAVADLPAPDSAPPDSAPSTDVGQRTLTVRIAGQGSIAASAGSLTCDHDTDPCSATYTTGTALTLDATAASGYAFAHWSGDCAGTADTVAVTLDANKDCTANFIGVSGDATVLSAPASVVANATESAQIRVFVEQVATTLAAAMPFDVHVPDSYTDDTKTTPGALPAGTQVTVYLLHFDPVGVAAANANATLIFPRQILALAHTAATLDATDPTGTGVAYPAPGGGGRNLELTNPDSYTLAPNRRTLTVALAASTSSDQLRVITRAGGPLPVIVSSTVNVAAAAPTSLEAGQVEDSAKVLMLAERQDVNLAGALAVNINVAGSYPPDALTGGNIAAGTTVDGYLLHFDPVGTTSATVMASVTFDRTILGVIVEQAELTASTAALGLTSTVVYPAAGPLEIGSDTVYFAGDNRSLRVVLSASTGIDQLRVVLE